MDNNDNIVKVKKDGQVTIPKAIRTRAKLKDGDLVKVFLSASREICITPVKAVYIARD